LASETAERGGGQVAQVRRSASGEYRYIEGVFQYSAGVAAEPGFALERARFSRPVPLAEGFVAIERHLRSVGRPLSAFCACELRSPAPFSEREFTAFNREYVATLDRWGIVVDDRNPVARTNVCPEYAKPESPSIHAFSYTVPAAGDGGSFIIAGSGEAQEGAATYRESIVCLGETSPEALREKARFVVDTMEARLAVLGFGWDAAGTTNAYTVHDLGSLADAEIFRRGAAPNGLTWHFCRPPVIDIEFEMDVLGPIRDVAL
jgi:hypothetical protein